MVEHDEEAILEADWIVDIGPGAGVHGGRVVAQGKADVIKATPESITGQYLSANAPSPFLINAKFLAKKKFYVYKVPAAITCAVSILKCHSD